jgi:hypothetical protein
VALEADGGFEHSAPPAAASWERVLDAIDTSLTNWPAVTANPTSSTDGDRT